MMQNCLSQKDLQILVAIFSYKMYIFLFNLKNTIKNKKFNFLTKICEIRKKTLKYKTLCLNSRTIFFILEVCGRK